MDIETILSMYEDDYTPAIGPRAMVGEITEEQTQFGRPIYQTPSGEKVSEKSMTLFFNGNWMNVPSIHGGKSFNEDELRLMIKQGNIEPTSVHKSKADAETAAKDRSNSMVQELRPMAQGGRIPFDNGGDTSPVKTEEYKYPRSNRFGTVYSKTPGTNQYGALTRSLEEVQAIIDNAPKIQKKNKVVEMTEKDLTGQSKYNNVSKKVGPAKIFVSRKELEKYEGKLNFKTSGKPILEDASKKNKVRQARDLARSNPTIFRKMSGKEGYQLAHLSLDELDSLKNLGYLPADINIKQYFPFEKKIVAISKDIYDIQKDKKLSIQEKRNKIAELQKKDRELRKQFPEYAKTKARLNVRATGLDSSGLMIKEKLPDPSIAIAPTEAGTTLKYIKTGSQKDAEVVKIAKENFLKNLENKKFGRVADVVVKASQEGGFGEAVQTICKRRKAKKGGRMFLSTGSGCPAAKDDPKGFLKSISENPKLAKFLKSAPGKKAMTMAARVTGNVLNPTTLIGGEVAFVLGDGLNNFASGLPLDESFDRAFVFADFGKFEKNLMNKAKELGYDDNQLNLLQKTIDINKLDNRKRKLEYGLDVEEQDISGLTSDATMGFEDRLVNTNKNLDDSVINYLNTLDKMGFDSNKAADQATGFIYLDNVFKKRTQDQMLKTYDKRKRQLYPTKTPFGDFVSPFFDLGTYTQPLKFAADIFNPFTKDVPFLSERQRKAIELGRASEEELDKINKERGFTIEDIQQGTSPQIRETMDYLGTDVTGQGFGTTSLAEGGITTLRSKYEYKK